MFDMWSHSPHNIPTIMLLSIKYLSRYHYKCGHLKATPIEPSHCSHQLLKKTLICGILIGFIMIIVTMNLFTSCYK